MADICVVYLSEDETLVRRLVEALRKRWSVWWADDIAHGDWEEAVRQEIPKARLLLPVLSHHARPARSAILKDEMQLAKDLDKPILPFLIGRAVIPLGFGDLNRTDAADWQGDPSHPGFLRLLTKVAATLGSALSASTPDAHSGHSRARELALGAKTFPLPAFVFSLSSHETQITPSDGAVLLQQLEPGAALVSAYDILHSPRGQKDSFKAGIKRLHDSRTTLFLDSGNYEAYRKNDRHSRSNPAGWRREEFWAVARAVFPDAAFSFDSIRRSRTAVDMVRQTVRDFKADIEALAGQGFPLLPIVHLPELEKGLFSPAADVVADVASQLDPIMIAVPERELGDGIVARALAVRAIRKALDSLGKYYPLHLLGTGNPISIITLAAAGADAFDGLEWCRTVADNQSGFLFHFQQFDCCKQSGLHRVKDERVRYLLENPDAPYALRALSFNIDFFQEWMRTLRDMIHAGQTETLLKMVPDISHILCRELLG